MKPIPLPDELKGVSGAVLEEYVKNRISQFSRVFAAQLLPESPEGSVEFAYSTALSLLSVPTETREGDGFSALFRHRCRFLGCRNKSCVLCKNNPCKRCQDLDNFDECYADNQILKAKCEAEIYVELMNMVTAQPESLSGVEFQVCVIDGESYIEGNPAGVANVKQLLKSDEGQTLIGTHSAGCKVDPSGYLYLKLQDGIARLPDIYISDKTDTFHFAGITYSSFRLLSVAIKRDLYGNTVVLDTVAPAVSGKFHVKTQRALNDYRKSEWPHYKDELTKLKYIGNITAQRLKDIQQFLGDVPFTCIESVEQLKHLMMFADQNRQVENKLLELLNMKGKHKHKWEFLREVLLEKIVFDDMLHRAWYADEVSQAQGLLFACKQGQVNVEKPIGIIHRMIQQDGQSRLQVMTAPDSQNAEALKLWREAAEDAWGTPEHRGWTVVQEPLELVSANGTSVMVPVPGSRSGNAAPGGAAGGLGSAMPSPFQHMDKEQLKQRLSGSMSSPRTSIGASVGVGQRRPSSLAFQDGNVVPLTMNTSVHSRDFQFMGQESEEPKFNAYSAKSAPINSSGWIHSVPPRQFHGYSHVHRNSNSAGGWDTGANGGDLEPCGRSVSDSPIQHSFNNRGSAMLPDRRMSADADIYQHLHQCHQQQEHQRHRQQQQELLSQYQQESGLRGYNQNYELSFKRLRSSEPGYEEAGVQVGNFGGEMGCQSLNHQESGSLSNRLHGGARMPSPLQQHSSGRHNSQDPRNSQPSPFDITDPSGVDPVCSELDRLLSRDLPSFSMGISPNNGFGGVNGGSFPRQPRTIEASAQAALASFQATNPASDVDLMIPTQQQQHLQYTQQQQHHAAQQHLMHAMQSSLSQEGQALKSSPPDVSALRLSGDQSLARAPADVHSPQQYMQQQQQLLQQQISMGEVPANRRLKHGDSDSFNRAISMILQQDNSTLDGSGNGAGSFGRNGAGGDSFNRAFHRILDQESDSFKRIMDDSRFPGRIMDDSSQPEGFDGAEQWPA